MCRQMIVNNYRSPVPMSIIADVCVLSANYMHSLIAGFRFHLASLTDLQAILSLSRESKRNLVYLEIVCKAQLRSWQIRWPLKLECVFLSSTT